MSTAIGPLLDGLLVQLGGKDFGWRLVFYVNLPIGLLQTFQRVGSAIAVAVVLAQLSDRLASSNGDAAEGCSTALHTTTGLIVVALVLGLADLGRRRLTPEPRR